MVNLILLDVRSEADYNLFHLVDSRRVEMHDLAEESSTGDLLNLPDNSVIVLVSNDEHRSTEAWKLLTAQSVLNVYILEGGINDWLDLFGHLGHERCSELTPPGASEALRHVFEAAVGSDQPGADPDSHGDGHRLEYTPKVKLQKKRVLGGGCG
jgi:rhodanese-related sulfurtransferase